MSDRELTALQRRFINELMVDPSKPGEAYARAGGKDRQPPHGARQMMLIPQVREEVERRMRAHALKCEAKAVDIERELMIIGFSDIRDFIDWGPDGISIKDPADLPAPEMARCVQKIVQTERPDGSKRIEISLHSKVQALIRLGVYAGMWTPGRETHPDQIQPGVNGRQASEEMTDDEKLAVLEQYADLLKQRKRRKRLGYSNGRPVSVGSP